MNKKQIIFSVIAFFAAFLITIIIKFPLNAVVTNIITDTVQNKKIDIRYDSINVTFFGATATNVKTGPLVISNVQLDYNPLGLLFKRVAFKADSTAFNLSGKLSGSKLNADILRKFLWFHRPSLYDSYDTYAKMKRYRKEWKGVERQDIYNKNEEVRVNGL